MEKLQIKYEARINELVNAANYIDRQGYVTSQGGNLSYRADDNLVLITPTKVAKRSITFNDIVVVDNKGDIVFADKGRKPTGETPFHVHVLHKRPDLKALIHAHPPFITGLAIAGNNLLSRPLLPEPIIEIGPVLSVPYEEPLSRELADAFNEVVLHSNAFLMENHGILVGSYEGIERATELLDMLEATAKSVVAALNAGKINEIPARGVKKLENVMKTRNLPLPGLPGYNKNLVDLYY